MFTTLSGPARKAVAACTLSLAVLLFAAERPLPAQVSQKVELADMTWLEVRSAIERGYTTAIVPTGGIEQNGIHMILGKHDRLVRSAALRIAEEVGQTLITPVVSFVPQGSHEPPSGHLQFPGTLGVSDDAFKGTLDGVARSLKAAGIKTICFVSDHGASVTLQATVARRLNDEWTGHGVRVLDVADYYAEEAQMAYLKQQGEVAASIGQHAGILDTSELLAVHPEGVDLSLLAGLGWRVERTGATGDATRASAERGRAIIEIKIAAAVRQIRAGSAAIR